MLRPADVAWLCPLPAMTRPALGLLLGLLAAPPLPPAAPPPARPRALTAQEQLEVARVEARLQRHANAGEFEEAARLAGQVAQLRRQRQGARHWQAIDARFALEEWQRRAKVPPRDRATVVRAVTLHGEGMELNGRG